MSIKQNFPTIKPTLNLDFANSKTVDSRITFTRASAATYTDAQGILQTVRDNKSRIDFDPTTGECRGLLIEESRTNLYTRSGHPHMWNDTFNGAFLPNAAIAPDGTMTALLITATNADPFIYQTVSSLPGNVTVSVWVKATGAAIGKTGTIRISGNTVTTPAFTAIWQKVTASFNVTGSYIVGFEFPDSGAATGDQVYIWGPQVEAGTFATSYIPSNTAFTSRASSATYFDTAGVLRIAPAGGARYGYESPYKQVDFYGDASNNVIGNSQIPAGTSGALRSQGLVLEAAATNLVTYSYNMSTANTGYYFTGTGSFVVTGETTAPDNTYTASKFVFTGANDRVDQGYGTVPSAGWYTLSVWLKGVAGTVVQVSILTSIGGNVEPAVYLTGQWQRFSVRKYFNSGETLRVHAPIIRGAMGNSITAATGETGVYATYVYLWGLQIEAGLTATSYIPTYGATATRAADVSSSAATTRAADNAILDVSAIYTKDGISVIGEVESFGNNAGRIVALAPSVSDSSNVLSVNYESSYFRTYQYTDSALRFNTAGAGYTISTYQKFALGVASNAYSTVVNGYRESGTGATVYQMNSMRIGSMNTGQYYLSGHIKKLGLYPKKLTDTQLTALTV